MFQRILICTDFGDGLHRLAGFVNDLAIAGVQQAVFLHVVPLPESGIIPRVDPAKLQQARDRFTQALTDAPTDVEVKVEVQSGKAVDTILKVAKTYQTQLIVLGTQSRDLLTEKLFGSTLVNLSNRAKIPLLVLRPQLVTTYRTEELRLRCQHLFQYLLLPYNGSQPAQYMLEQVKTRVSNSASSGLEQCLVCWIVRDTGRRELPKDYLLQQAQDALVPVKAELAQLNVKVDVEVREGDAIPEVLAIAAAEDISAIVLSSDASSRRLEWFVSSFASELLRRSLHPLLFFPPA